MNRISVRAESPEPAAMTAAAGVLRGGGVVAFPTDTVYGLAADPRADAAVARLFAIKGRPEGLAIPLVAADAPQAARAGAFGVHERSEARLASRFWPGPLSIVVPAAPGISRHVLGAGSTVAVRVPGHAVARALAAAFGFCVTATSANRSGQPPAATADEVAATLGHDVDLLLDAGAAPGGPPSTIVRITTEGPELLRAGAIAWERVLESLQ